MANTRILETWSYMTKNKNEEGLANNDSTLKRAMQQKCHTYFPQ